MNIIKKFLLLLAFATSITPLIHADWTRWPVSGLFPLGFLGIAAYYAIKNSICFHEAFSFTCRDRVKIQMDREIRRDYYKRSNYNVNDIPKMTNFIKNGPPVYFKANDDQWSKPKIDILIYKKKFILLAKSVGYSLAALGYGYLAYKKFFPSK
ncbi:hypothetical protein KC460_04095 [Candidatus Dependentiae bacterium]|nr:hypothetical protein [Candidatus Dependentiae bacterium]